MLGIPVTSAVADSSCVKSPIKLAQIAPYMNTSPTSPCLPGQTISSPSKATSTAFAKHKSCKAQNVTFIIVGQKNNEEMQSETTSSNVTWQRYTMLEIANLALA
jgi:hypothetical protein